MPDIDREKRLAQTALVREQQKADASVAMADYVAGQQALRERTNKLREQRLAREADPVQKAPAKPAAKTSAKASAKTSRAKSP